MLNMHIKYATAVNHNCVDGDFTDSCDDTQKAGYATHSIADGTGDSNDDGMTARGVGEESCTNYLWFGKVLLCGDFANYLD